MIVQIIYRSFVRKLQASPHLGRPLAQLLPLLGYPRRLGHSRWPARLPSLGRPRRLGRPHWPARHTRLGRLRRLALPPALGAQQEN